MPPRASQDQFLTHVGPKFLTVSAIDRQGLSDNEATNVVLPFDIYPESQAIAKAYAALTDPEAKANWEKYGNMFLVVLSYSWLSKKHPDPDLFHLR